MAQYAYKYNDIYDDYLVQASPRSGAAPARKPQQRPQQTAPAKPELRKVRKTKQQVIKENQRKFKIALAKISVIFALFAAMIGMAANSKVELESKKQELESIKASYQVCLEENNNLKLQLDKALENVDIEKIAKERLGLQKIPESRRRLVDISEYQ